MKLRRHGIAVWLCAAGLSLGCVATGPSGGPPPSGQQQEQPRATAATPQQAQRLARTMQPLLRVMDDPVPLDQVSVGILDSNEINAANAGAGRFFVTKGLLARANDAELSGVLAHEIAHEDLNHVAKAQVRAAGIGIGIAILDQVFPGTGAITPIAGELVFRKYSRDEEYAADAHGAELLRRSGQRPEIMVATLTWLMRESGPSPGGFFSTHPGTEDRIAALRNQR